MASGPTIQRGSSSGDIWTPRVFIDAVEKRFGLIGWDLAATAESSKAHYPGFYLSPEQDSLTYSWHGLSVPHGSLGQDRPLCWLNPPYANITPWVKKCAEVSLAGAQILLLVPMGGQDWYWRYVEPFADVYSVGRMTFDNCFDKAGNLVTTAYPKDLILAHYHNTVEVGEHQKMQRWKWR